MKLRKTFGIIFALGTLFALIPNALALTKMFQVHTLSGGSLTTGLVSYWNMQGNSNDYYGSNNGTDTSVSYGTSYGKVNEGANFNGSTSLINLGSPASLTSISGSATINFAAWVYLTSVPASGSAFYIVRQGGESTSMWGMAVCSPNGTTAYAAFRTASPGTNGRSQYGSTTAITLNTWHFVTASVQGGTATAVIYVDGVSQAITTWDGSNANYVFNASTANIFIGHSANPDYFPGDIDEVGIWNKALSAQEISDLYNGGAGQTMCNGTGGPLCSTPRHHVILISFEAKPEHFQFA